MKEIRSWKGNCWTAPQGRVVKGLLLVKGAFEPSREESSHVKMRRCVQKTKEWLLRPGAMLTGLSLLWQFGERHSEGMAVTNTEKLLLSLLQA